MLDFTLYEGARRRFHGGKPPFLLGFISGKCVLFLAERVPCVKRAFVLAENGFPSQRPRGFFPSPLVSEPRKSRKVMEEVKLRLTRMIAYYFCHHFFHGSIIGQFREAGDP